jgi:exonuclease SbcC
LQKVRSLDQKIADQKKAVSEGDEGCKKDSAKINADKKNKNERAGKTFQG